MGGRSTAIKLSSGDVWVVASTPLSNETKEAVQKLGTVKYIVAADADHHIFLSGCLSRLWFPTNPMADIDWPFCK